MGRSFAFGCRPAPDIGEAVDLIPTIKRVFDPKGLFNPERTFTL